MKTAEKPTSNRASDRRPNVARAHTVRAANSASIASKPSRVAALPKPVGALKVTVDVAPLLAAVRRHVHLSPNLAKLIKGDFMRLLHNPGPAGASKAAKGESAAPADPVLSTQEAADLVGVSRPYIVARIEAGDIPLHQQVGNQRRVLKSAVMSWHRSARTHRRRALAQLGVDLDGEIFAG